MNALQNKKVVRKILVYSAEFKTFWSTQGPFRYALTSKDFPPVLLEPEEWIFSDDLVTLLKELMQFEQRKMAFVKAPFNVDRKEVFKPDSLIPWRILNFCDEWSVMTSDLFTPVGYLTRQVMTGSNFSDNAAIEKEFYEKLEHQMDQMGYILLKPLSDSSKSASVHEYLKEWESDEDFLL